MRIPFVSSCLALSFCRNLNTSPFCLRIIIVLTLSQKSRVFQCGVSTAVQASPIPYRYNLNSPQSPGPLIKHDNRFTEVREGRESNISVPPSGLLTPSVTNETDPWHYPHRAYSLLVLLPSINSHPVQDEGVTQIIMPI
jgi:hypothetical protein